MISAVRFFSSNERSLQGAPALPECANGEEDHGQAPVHILRGDTSNSSLRDFTRGEDVGKRSPLYDVFILISFLSSILTFDFQAPFLLIFHRLMSLLPHFSLTSISARAEDAPRQASIHRPSTKHQSNRWYIPSFLANISVSHSLA